MVSLPLVVFLLVQPVPTVALGNHLHTGVYLGVDSFTGANILSKLITVDGHGSGLDADTVDGYHLHKEGNWGKIPYIGGMA